MRGPTGICQQNMTGDEIGEGGCQKQNRAGHILGRAETFEQVFAQSVSPKVGVGQKILAQLGFDEGRRHGIDQNSVGCPIHGQDFGNQIEPGFAGAIRGPFGQGD